MHTWDEVVMGIEIRLCTVADIEASPTTVALLAEYAQESAIDGLGAPEAQMDLYRQLEASGILNLLCAFQEDAIVGFLAFLVSTLPHYGLLVATTESYFVAGAARKSGAGLKLLHEAERIAKELGAVGFLVSAPMRGRLEMVLPKVGYRQTNRVFFRSLR